MKKIAVALSVLVVSFGANAGDYSAAIKAADGKLLVTSANCTSLSEDVTVNMSKGVAGGVSCVEATKVIAFAACHPSGRKTGTIDQTAITKGAVFAASSGGGKPQVSDATCADDGTASKSAADTLAGKTS